MRFVLRQFKRVTLLVLLVAAILVVSVPLTLAYMLVRYHEMKRRGIPGGPPVREPAGGDRTMDEIAYRLQEVPFKPVRPLLVGMAKAGLNNSFLMLLNTTRRTAARLYPYPEDFEEVTFESFDGSLLTAAVGLHRDGRPRPGLVLSHGFMGSKNDHYIVDTALTAFAGWGYNVLAIDLRNFGKSQCLGHCPTTAGWKEGEDLLAGAKFLGEQQGVSTVGIMGFSMGAGSTMRAAYMASEYPYLTGGAIAWNGYSDARRMIEYISKQPRPGEPFFPVYASFVLMHHLRRADMRDYIDDPELLEYLGGSFRETDFASYVEKIAAPAYGVSPDELYANASSKEYLADVKVPLLIIHAADDPVCPPDEMDVLMELAEDNPKVNVWMMPAGNHCMFRYLDRDWYESVVRGYFDYWAGWELARVAAWSPAVAGPVADL
jgi:pimeloyl-ACP methyl ester carboxylesterase